MANDTSICDTVIIPTGKWFNVSCSSHTAPSPLCRRALVNPFVNCTPVELTLKCEVAMLPAGLQKTVAGWLRLHGINPDVIVTGTPIVRDPQNGTLCWHSIHADGTRRRNVRSDDGATNREWPGPFPDALVSSPPV